MLNKLVVATDVVTDVVDKTKVQTWFENNNPVLTGVVLILVIVSAVVVFYKKVLKK